MIDCAPGTGGRPALPWVVKASRSPGVQCSDLKVALSTERAIPEPLPLATLKP